VIAVVLLAAPFVLTALHRRDSALGEAVRQWSAWL
jgi:hypothetical protein